MAARAPAEALNVIAAGEDDASLARFEHEAARKVEDELVHSGLVRLSTHATHPTESMRERTMREHEQNERQRHLRTMIRRFVHVRASAKANSQTLRLAHESREDKLRRDYETRV